MVAERKHGVQVFAAADGFTEEPFPFAHDSLRGKMLFEIRLTVVINVVGIHHPDNCIGQFPLVIHEHTLPDGIQITGTAL